MTITFINEWREPLLGFSFFMLYTRLWKTYAIKQGLIEKSKEEKNVIEVRILGIGLLIVW